MTDRTLEPQGGAVPERETLEQEWGDSHWVKRTVAVMSCLMLVVALVFAFTRATAVRIPEQRATLEKLIADRTGLEVRFDNVHFAWDLDGASAVFTRVELVDPNGGRVRVVAPELRVELDTWDFVRHSQFSFGHVTLRSPDIEIIRDAEVVPATARGAAGARTAKTPPREDEVALVRHYLSWAEVMPLGRIEVEGARVHLMHRGERVARHTFTLSQAVVSRGNSTFNAYGTMLLAQDVGQSLFVSAKLEGLAAGGAASGDLRVIARRVFLQKLDLPGVTGRGTLDARLALREDRLESGSWQASVRDLRLDDGSRFDHVSLNGRLTRQAGDVLLELTDLQLARGARLERAPALSARLALAAGSLDVVGATMRAERLPFMAGQLVAGVMAPHVDHSLSALAEEWAPTAGELRAVRFASAQRTWSFDAQIAGLELTRASDQARLSQLAARLHMNERELTVQFDRSAAATLHEGAGPRPLTLSGQLARQAAPSKAWHFDALAVTSGAGSMVANGSWAGNAPGAAKLEVELHAMDRGFLAAARNLLAPDAATPRGFDDIGQGTITEGRLQLAPAGDGGVDWNRSSGRLALVDLTTGGEDLPRLTAGRGAVQFARGGTRLTLDGGALEDLAIREARVDWPRNAPPRLHASLEGELSSPVLRPVLESQGLENLRGNVVLEADARGERELNEPRAWRLSARVNGATVPLGDKLPAVEALQGSLRYSGGQLRALALSGEWLGGTVEIGLRRGGFSFNGVADAVPLLRLLGQPVAAEQVSGQFAWTGSAQQSADGAPWQVSLSSNFAGVESRLPEPFGKARGRALATSAEFSVARDGIRSYQITSGRALALDGRVREGVMRTRFEYEGLAGEVRRAADVQHSVDVDLDRLDLEHGHEVLAVAAALLPADGELRVDVRESRYAERSLGPLHASLARGQDQVSFAFDSPAVAVHQLSGRGQCGADGHCRAEFSADTTQLTALLRDAKLPAEWPAARLQAKGSLAWPASARRDITESLSGRFDLRTESADGEHQLTARATLADGQILLTDVQGTGPEPDQVFRGEGRVGLLARNYDLTVDYERVTLAAAAVPSPARARLARAWNAMRGTAARRGWTDPPEARRVQWHGTWD
jgi:hypothetical protein